jgi:hypothetical protein
MIGNLLAATLAALCIGGPVASIQATEAKAETEWIRRSASSVGVAKSSVLNDLVAFSGGTLNLQTLMPDPNAADAHTKYNDFRYLTTYAWDGDVYLYFYINLQLVPAMDYTAGFGIIYSTSTTLDTDGSIKEDPVEVSAVPMMNHSGGFFKCKLEKIYTATSGNVHRFAVLDVIGYNAKHAAMVKDWAVNNALSFQDTDKTADQIFQYYENRTFNIPQKEIWMLLSPMEFTSDGYISKLQEDSYCFFNTSIDMDYIQDMEFVYWDDEWSYSTDYQSSGDLSNAIKWRKQPFDGFMKDGKPVIDKTVQQAGYKTNILGITLKDDAYDDDLYNYWSLNLKPTKASSEWKDTTVKPGTYTYGAVDDRISSSAWGLFSWLLGVRGKSSFTASRLMKLTSDNLGTVTDAYFRRFLTDHSSSIDSSVNFTWMASIGNSFTRSTTTSTYQSWNFETWGEHIVTKGVFHQPSDVQILRIHYWANNVEYNLNAIDTPTDLSGVSMPPSALITTYQVYPSWITKIGNFFTSVWDALAAKRSYFIWIGVIAAAVVVLLVILWIVSKANPSPSPSYSRSKKSRSRKR